MYKGVFIMSKSIVKKIEDIKERNIKFDTKLSSGKLKVIEKRGFNGHSVTDPVFCSYFANGSR